MAMSLPYQALGRLSIEQLADWADEYMASRPCDVYIGPGHDHQLERWFILPRNNRLNLYLHRFLRSDDDRAMHDHPGDNRSTIIRGCYLECTPSGNTLYRAGDSVSRVAEDAHRVELVDGPCVSLFVVHNPRRVWGFHCPGGWVDFETYNRGGGCP